MDVNQVLRSLWKLRKRVLSLLRRNQVPKCLGLLYLATFWSGFSAAMTIVDFIIAVPMKPDENGNIWL